MPKLDLDAIPQSNDTGYPAPFHQEVQGRWWRRLAPVLGLTQMGASHVVLKPGAWSSQRHWHIGEDELVVMLSGEAVLVGKNWPVLRAGDVAGWAAGVQNGHKIEIRSDADCVFVAISAGDRSTGGAYSDIDMTFGEEGYFHRDGKPYPTKRLP